MTSQEQVQALCKLDRLYEQRDSFKARLSRAQYDLLADPSLGACSSA